MTVNVSNTELNNSFNSWRLNTNYIATIISNNVVTVSRSGSANRGGAAVGNGHIKGTFSATEFRTNTIKGGNTSSLTGGTITVASNTIIDPQTFTVNANTTFNANVTFATSGSDTLTLGDISRVRVTGGSAGQFLRIDTNTNTPAFKSFTLRDVTDLSSNSAHLILSGANTSFGEALDSPHLRFTGGTGNGDAVEIFLAGDSTIGDSDLYLQLSDAAGDSKLVVTDNANTIVASIDSNGNVIFEGALHVEGAVDFDSTLDVVGKTTLGQLHANAAVDFDTTLNVDGATTLNGLTVTTVTANGAVDLNSTLNVDGATTLNGNITLGDAQGDTITVKGKFANQATTGAATFGGTSIFNGVATFNNTVNLNGDVNLGDAAADSLVITSTTTLGSNATIGDSSADTLTVNSRVMSHLVANGAYDLGSSSNEWRKLYVEEADIDGALTNDGTVIISSNGKLHANNTVSADTILNSMIQNDHIEIGTNGAGSNIDVRLGSLLSFDEGEGLNVAITANTITFSAEDASTSNKGVASFAAADFNVTAGAVELEDSVLKQVTTDSGTFIANSHTLTMAGGEGIDLTHTVSGDILVSGEDASTTNKGVAKFDSGDFTVSTGTVALKDATTGAVLSIAGTANEVGVSRTNGTVTVGLPDTLVLGTTAGSVSLSGTLTANAHTQTIGTNRTASNEATRNAMWVNGGLSTLNVYANTVLHDSVAIPGSVSAGEGNFSTLVVQNQSIFRGDVDFGNASGDLLSFTGSVDTDIIPNADASHDLGSTTKHWKNVYVNDVRASANVHIAGDLIVSGTTTTVNTATLDVADNKITLNSDLGAGVAPTENAGVFINRGSQNDVDIRWNETSDIWQLTENGTQYDEILTDNGRSIADRVDLSSSVVGGDYLLVLDASDTGKLKKSTITNAALQGVKGQKGEVGVKGDTGAKGQKGEIGAKGEVGVKGDTGSKGQKGEIGATGATGTKGQKGEIGATGATGTKGQKGEIGATGATGAKGQKGEIGATGATGAKGQKGEIGAQGIQGIQGAKGQKGEIGAQGIQGTKGQKGEIGATGAKGQKGQKGEIGATGATGQKGEKGQKGINGVVPLTDPNADRIVFWDDSVNAYDWLSYDTAGIEISGTVLDSEYVNSLGFNTGNGILTLGRNLGLDLTVDLDGRYIQNNGNLFILEDEDGTEVTISNNNEVKMLGGNYIKIDWTDTSNGSDTDPYDMTFTHENTTRSDGTTTNSPAHGDDFDCVSSVTTNAEGHVTGVITKTVTLPDADVIIATGLSNDYDSSGAVNSADALEQLKGRKLGTPQMSVTGAAGTGISLRANRVQNEAVGLTDTIGSVTIGTSAGSTHYTNATLYDGLRLIHYIPSGENYDTYAIYGADGTGGVANLFGVNGTNGNISVKIGATIDGVDLSALNTTVSNITSDTGIPAILSDGATPTLNAGITALEVRTLIGAGTSSLSVHDTPVNGATTTAISSNWAFDNVKTAVPAEAVFTDSDTVTGIRVSSGSYLTGNFDFVPGRGIDLGFDAVEKRVYVGLESDLRGEVDYIGGIGDTNTYVDFSVDDEVTIVAGSIDMMTFRETTVDIIFTGSSSATKHLFNVTNGDFHADGDITAYSTTTTSDARLKKNITVVENALDKVCALNGVEFDWIEESRGSSAGVVAQEVESVFPSAVKELESMDLDGGGETYKAVDYNQLSALFIESIKELRAENAELRAMIEEGKK